MARWRILGGVALPWIHSVDQSARLTISVDSDDEEIIRLVERAALANGVTIVRVDDE